MIYQTRPAVDHLGALISLHCGENSDTAYRGSSFLSMFMHLWTSTISLTGSATLPERFAPQIFSKSTIPELNKAICKTVCQRRTTRESVQCT